MEMKDIIEKVNYYAKLSKERKLTEEEIKDREIYRRMYLDQFKAQVKEHLDNIEIFAKEIIKTQAKRNLGNGFKFSKDTVFLNDGSCE